MPSLSAANAIASCDPDAVLTPANSRPGGHLPGWQADIIALIPQTSSGRRNGISDNRDMPVSTPASKQENRFDKPYREERVLLRCPECQASITTVARLPYLGHSDTCRNVPVWRWFLRRHLPSSAWLAEDSL